MRNGNFMRTLIIFLFSVFAFCSSFAQTGWIMQKSGTTANLFGISTYDGRNAVAVGDKGTVVTTDYAGVPWTLRQNLTDSILRGVTSISAKILCAVGFKDSIFRSTDRGYTWNSVKSSWRGECFSNLGLNQLPEPPPDPRIPRHALLTAITYDTISKLCIAVGDQQECVISSDSGKHWVEKLTYPYRYVNLTHLRCVSSTEGKILTSGTIDIYGPKNFPLGTFASQYYVSSNQGEDWLKRSPNNSNDFKIAGPEVLGCNVKTWILAGTGGVIYHSATKGVLWDVIPSGVNSNLNAVCFADEINGFIVGDNGVILMTRDGGYNWVRQYSPTNENLRSVSMFDPFHGFICGDKGTILYTQDGGFYSDAVFASPQSGFSVKAYPNPASAKTSIEITMPHRSHVCLRIYNSLGEQVADLANGSYEAGKYSFGWDGSNTASGVYICRLEADGYSVSTQLNLVK